MPRLWRQWSPALRAEEDLRHVDAAIGTPESWRAALGPYRAAIRGSRPPQRYQSLHQYWLSAPRVPTLYLHGNDDGCMSAAFARWVQNVIPSGSDVAVPGMFQIHQCANGIVPRPGRGSRSCSVTTKLCVAAGAFAHDSAGLTLGGVAWQPNFAGSNWKSAMRVIWMR